MLLIRNSDYVAEFAPALQSDDGVIFAVGTVALAVVPDLPPAKAGTRNRWQGRGYLSARLSAMMLH
jgi:hypothetical protein